MSETAQIYAIYGDNPDFFVVFQHISLSTDNNEAKHALQFPRNRWVQSGSGLVHIGQIQLPDLAQNYEIHSSRSMIFHVAFVNLFSAGIPVILLISAGLL